MTELQEVDKFLDEYDGEQAYDVLVERLKQTPESVDDLWRMAHACYIKSNLEDDHKRRLELLSEGRGHALKAVEKEPQNGVVLKWAATLTGVLAENSGIREKVNLGHEFKDLLDRAIAQLPDEATLIHMRGRFFFQVAGMGTLERTMAAMLFHSLPKASYEEALQDLLKMEELVAGDLDNQLYIGKCYYQMNKFVEAREWLQTVAEAVAVDAVDAEHIAEAKELLARLPPADKA